eukprot:CAMPEP_0172051220 /NCGR_PEP_ID=MMETSP1043-20130122/3016_1 /TAXON_ID=464988 /ORGANISM="Hemiselmis andersenii, Strain CCMP441" /LENGTH=178 /DNA_ID=CAMNT_0012710307 /DNA_START=318 /DNA_END=850 /DNA_ORIENTATION=+
MGQRPRSEPKCPTHTGEVARFVARTGGGLLCRDCVLLGDLKAGDYAEVSVAAAEARSRLEKALGAAMERVRELRQGQEKVASTIPAVHEAYVNVVGAVQGKAETMEMNVRGRRDAWARKAEQEREAAVLDLMRQCEALGQLKRGVSNAVRVGERVWEGSDELDCLETMAEMRDALGKV